MGGAFWRKLRGERARPLTARARLVRFTLRRVAAAVLLCIGITFVAFVLTHLVPGDPAAAYLGDQGVEDAAAVAAFRHHYGLDKPVPEQYVIYLDHLVHGDLGESQQSHRPVLTDLRQYVPASAELAITAGVIGAVVGISLGLLAAVFRDRWPDHLLRVISLIGVSMPLFWLALVVFYIFFFKFGIAPGGGRLDPGLPPPPHVTGMYTVDAALAGQWTTLRSALAHLVLPALVLAAYAVGVLTRFTRASALDVLGDDYIRTARAKGLPGYVVILRHVFRPTLIGVLTVVGLMFGSLFSGAVLIETIFSWPGVGQYAYNSAINLDLPAIMGVSLFIAVVYVVINFVVDVLYGVVDPRIRLQ